MAWLAGHGGSVLLGDLTTSISLSATNWMIDWVCDTVDVSNFNGQGWGAYMDGVPEFNLRVDAVFDPVEDPFGGANAVVPGETISCVLYMDEEVAGSYYEFSDVVVMDVTMEQGIRDTVRYSFTGKASAYTAAADVTPPNIV